MVLVAAATLIIIGYYVAIPQPQPLLNETIIKMEPFNE